MTESTGNRTYRAIPPDIARSWIKGEYLIGASESTGYEYIGWSLLLRGMYIYEVRIDEQESSSENQSTSLTNQHKLPANNKKPYSFPYTPKSGSTKRQILSHWGLCTIDIKDGDLTYQGIRLHTNLNAMTRTSDNSIRLWQSEFSKISRGRGSPHAYFGYVMFNKDNDDDKADSAARTAFLNRLVVKEEDFKEWQQDPLAVPPTPFHLKRCKEKEYEIDTKHKEHLKLILEHGPKFLNSDLEQLLVDYRPHKSEQIISIIHIDLKDWLNPNTEFTDVKGEYQLVNSDAGHSAAAGSGTIIWTPLPTSLNAFKFYFEP